MKCTASTVAVALSVMAVMIVAADARALMSNRTMAPPHWSRVSPASPSTPLNFFVGLQMANTDKLDALYEQITDPDSPMYRQFMSRDEVLQLTRPEESQRSMVRSWLQGAGIRRIIDHSDAFEVHTTVEVASALLATEFYSFENAKEGRTVVRAWGSLTVPESLRNVVVIVAGLTEFPIRHGNAIQTPTAGSAGVVPQTVQNVYGVPASPNAGSTNTSVGVIEWEGQGFAPSDLASFATSFAVNIPVVSPSHDVGGPGSEGTEAILDIEVASATAQGVENWFWLNGGSAWLYGFATAFLSASDVPLVVSMSYGWSEEDQCEQGIGGSECQQLGLDSTAYVQLVNTKFQAIGVRGVSLFASSGDSGANGRTDEDCLDQQLHPTFPAASPYVTSVGATQLTPAQTNLKNPPPACQSGQVVCASGGTEVAVSYAQAHFASGGGFSNVAARPSWQDKAVTAYLNGGVALPPASYFNSTSRGYPDIAGFGSNVIITANGQLQGVGGTSCSSPITAGLFALVNAAALKKDGKPLGPLNPLLYKIADSNPDAFNDITVGDNKCTESGCGFGGSCKGYEAAAGWDPVTGLGSPNYHPIVQYVQNNL